MRHAPIRQGREKSGEGRGDYVKERREGGTEVCVLSRTQYTVVIFQTATFARPFPRSWYRCLQFLEQSPPLTRWQVRSAGQNIPCPFVHKSLAQVPILSQINPVHILPTHVPLIHFNIIPSSASRSSDCSLPFRFPNQNFFSFLKSPFTEEETPFGRKNAFSHLQKWSFNRSYKLRSESEYLDAVASTRALCLGDSGFNPQPRDLISWPKLFNFRQPTAKAG